MSLTETSLPSSAGDVCGHRFAAEAIAWEDWDLLFRAALELLANLAVEKSRPDDSGTRLQAPGAALRECLEALDHLRRSPPTEQSEQRVRMLHARGEFTSDAPASELSRLA